MSTTMKTLRLYTKECAQHPWLFTGALFMGPGAILQNIISPLFIAKLLGQLANHSPISVAYIYGAAVSLASGAIVTYAADRFFSKRLTVMIMHHLYDLCLSTFMQQDYSFFTDNFTGSLVTSANRLVKGYILFVDTIYLDMLGIWAGVIAALAIMIHYNALLGSIVAVFWVLAVTVVFLLVKQRIPLRRRAVNMESRITGELADIIGNVITIKTFSRSQNEETRFKSFNTKLSESYNISWGRAISNHFTLQIICAVMQLTVLIGGVYDVRKGSLSLATFLLFQVYILRIIDSVMKASLQMRQLEGVFGDAADMTELIDRTPTVLDPKSPQTSRIKHGAIKFKGVGFNYENQTNETESLLKEFNLSIKPGEKIGLVGPSGGGKTTLTKLVLRFIDVQSGSITIDGQDIRDITQDDLHEAISYVPQEPLLFHRTIRENISYGSNKATTEQIESAAKAAHAHDFIMQLPEGYSTLVGERGIKLSGGQRQRISIARALLRPTPILILDEATSALDSQSEAYIQSSLKELMVERTTLVIAHRLSTIQHLDRILVLDNGKIIEEGTHDQLLAKQGLYAKLWSRQTNSFIEG
jgi:ATP-binding cassette subfamily B protein